MLFTSVAITLFALTAGMFLLAKTKKEGLGAFFTWISYLVIAVSLLMLICLGTRGVMRMACYRGACGPMENCMPGMMNGQCDRGGCMMMSRKGGCNMGGEERCMEEIREYRMKGDSAYAKMKMRHGCPMMDEEKEMKDSVKK